jgi:hypothetical protein
MKAIMYRISLIIICCFLIFSCKKDLAQSDCTKDIYTHEYYINSKIDTIVNPAGLFFQINPGNDLIFLYTHIGSDCKNIADEEYVDRLVFKVPAGSSSFNYENSQLTDLLCLFMRSSFWSNGASGITTGFVKGTKRTDGKWDVEINVDIGGSVGRIIINKTFTPH